MPDDPVPIETLLRVLRHRRRRRVLSFFDETGVETAHVDHLVEYLVAGNDERVDPERVELELHHRALPALADAGVVDYDPARNAVRYRGAPRLERVRSAIAEIAEAGPCDW